MMANEFASGFSFGKGVVDDSVLQQRTSRLSELASQAYGAQGPQRDALVQQAVRIDPTSGMALGDKLQGREDDRKGRMAGAAKYLLSAFERGDQAAIQGAYRTVRPEFEALSNGAQLPDQVDGTILPMLHQVIAASQGQQEAGTPAQLQTFNAMTSGLDPKDVEKARRIQLGLDGRASSAGFGFDTMVGSDGRERPTITDPRTGVTYVYSEQQGNYVPLGGVGGAPQAPAAPPRQGQPGMTQVEYATDDGQPIPPEDAALVQAAFAADGRGEQFHYRSDQPIPQQRANPGLGVSRRPEDEAAAVEAAKLSAQLGALPAKLRLEVEAELRKVEGKAGVEAGAKVAETAREKSNAMAQYEAGMAGVMEGLGQAETGPLVGRLPAFTTSQQIAQGGVAAIAPVLKSLFRTAGEGTFTDKDQDLLMQMIPTRIDTPGSIEWKLQNIDRIVRAKLNAAPQQPDQGSDQFQGFRVLD